MESTDNNTIVKTEPQLDIKPDIPAITDLLKDVKTLLDNETVQSVVDNNTSSSYISHDIKAFPVDEKCDISNSSTVNHSPISGVTESDNQNKVTDTHYRVNVTTRTNSHGRGRLKSSESWTKKIGRHCIDCNLSHFGYKTNFVRHLKLHLGINRSLAGGHIPQKVFVCHVCGRKCTSLSDYKMHEAVHTGIKPYLCDLCNKRFRCKRRLRDHISKIHLNVTEPRLRMQNARHGLYIQKIRNQYSCEICSKVYSGNEALQTHIRTQHTGERPFQCHLCEKSFFERRGLKTHLTSHDSGERPYMCSECPASAKSKNNFKSHYAQKHKHICNSYLSTKNLVLCSKCNKFHYANVNTFKTVFMHHQCFDPKKQYMYKKNMKHKMQGMIQCTECPTTFESSQTMLHLTQSMQQHMELVHFQHIKSITKHVTTCPLCLNMYLTSPGLRTHDCNFIFNELHKRLYQCTECDKICSYVQNLNMHMNRKHPSIKTTNRTIEMCQVCKKCYFKASSLNKHECLADTKDKLYQCTECATQCITIHHLKLHLKVKHPAIQEKDLVSHFCAKCGRMYGVAPSLASHICQLGVTVSRKGRDDSIPNIVFSCDICQTTFTSKYELRHHLNMHVNRNRFLCELCNKEYSSIGALNFHLKSHLSLIKV